MRRVRAFRRRPEAPCRFSTWLAVVVKNVALDHMRSRDGRFRPFRVIDAMDEPDRLIFEYYHHQGRSLEEVRSLLAERHGIRLTESDADARVARVSALLTPSQRWRLLARIHEKRGPLPLDAVDGEAPGAGQVVAEAGEQDDPERPLLKQAAARALDDAFRSMEPPQRLALTLRFRDGLAVKEVAGFMHVTPEEASRLEGAGLARVREAVRRHGVSRPDIETKSLSLPWTGA